MQLHDIITLIVTGTITKRPLARNKIIRLGQEQHGMGYVIFWTKEPSQKRHMTSSVSLNNLAREKPVPSSPTMPPIPNIAKET